MLYGLTCVHLSRACPLLPSGAVFSVLSVGPAGCSVVHVVGFPVGLSLVLPVTDRGVGNLSRVGVYFLSSGTLFQVHICL